LFRVALYVVVAFNRGYLPGKSAFGDINPFHWSEGALCTAVTASVTLPAGLQVLTLDEDSAGWNIDTTAFAVQ
jgi:hypothetical protein